jgi:mannosyltransferase OCH1-like enzyme
MIPKQLFFIWFGDNKPNYVDFSISKFKEVNPDFKINFLRYTINQIDNLSINNLKNEFDVDVYNCIQYILNKNRYKISIDNYISYGRKFTQILANILRLELISKYGGIYLDCDTFPVKPFDDELLNRNNFCCYTPTSYDMKHRHKDCHFIGSVPNFYYSIFHVLKDNIDTNIINFIDDESWKDRREKFYNCELIINDYNNIDYNYYIEHFVDRTWKTGKTPICKYDT